MSGYKRDIVIRVVPVNGSESIHWFEDRLTDVAGHTRCGVTYPRTMTMREDINRALRPVVYAKRAQVQIETIIWTMADHWFLQEIAEALDDPAYYSVFLSLDGGVVEREVVWLDASGVPPMPIHGKTVVGATFTLSLQTKYPIGPRGPMMTDPGIGYERVQDGGIEAWSAGAPVNWTGSSGVGTVAQETTLIAADGGLSSAKITRSDGTTAFTFTPSAGMLGISRNNWYRLSAAGRADAAMSPMTLRVQLFNLTKGVVCQSDGKTWAASAPQAMPGDITINSSGFTTAAGYFRFPSTFAVTDDIRPRFNGLFTGIVYYDSLSIYGPALRPGYATW